MDQPHNLCGLLVKEGLVVADAEPAQAALSRRHPHEEWLIPPVQPKRHWLAVHNGIRASALARAVALTSLSNLASQAAEIGRQIGFSPARIFSKRAWAKSSLARIAIFAVTTAPVERPVSIRS